LKEIPMLEGESGYPKEIYFNLDNTFIGVSGDETTERPTFETADEGFTFDLDPHGEGRLTVGRQDLANTPIEMNGSTFIAAAGPGATAIVGSIGAESVGRVYVDGTNVNTSQSEIELKLPQGGELFDISVAQTSEKPSGPVDVTVENVKIGNLDVALKTGSTAVRYAEVQEANIDARRAKTDIELTAEEDVKVTSTTGDIRIGGQAKTWEAKTSTGKVTIYPRTQGTVEASSDYGEVRDHRPPSANQ
jgi:hypothetical protein